MKLIKALVLIFFVGCSAPTITSNSEKSTNFNSYSSFSLANRKAILRPNQHGYENPEINKIIKQAIANELIAAGYKLVKDNPDLLVVYDIVITEMVDPRVDSAVIYKPWVDTKIDSFNYSEGLLVVRLIDQRKGKMVWQGSLSGILNRNPKQFSKRAETYISKLFVSLHKQIQ